MTAAVVLRKPLTQPILEGSMVQLRALWVEPALEDRLEITFCMLYFVLQLLLASDEIALLTQGAQPMHFKP